MQLYSCNSLTVSCIQSWYAKYILSLVYIQSLYTEFTGFGIQLAIQLQPSDDRVLYTELVYRGFEVGASINQKEECARNSQLLDKMNPATPRSFRSFLHLCKVDNQN